MLKKSVVTRELSTFYVILSFSYLFTLPIRITSNPALKTLTRTFNTLNITYLRLYDVNDPIVWYSIIVNSLEAHI